LFNILVTFLYKEVVLYKEMVSLTLMTIQRPEIQIVISGKKQFGLSVGQTKRNTRNEST